MISDFKSILKESLVPNDSVKMSGLAQTWLLCGGAWNLEEKKSLHCKKKEKKEEFY